MGTPRVLSPVLSVLISLSLFGCTASDDTDVPTGPEPQTVDDVLDLEDVHRELGGLLDHYAEAGVDFSSPERVASATEDYLRERFAGQRDELEEGLRALFVGVPSPGVAVERASDELTRLDAAFATTLATSTSTEEIASWLARERQVREADGLTPELVWLDAMERAVSLAPEFRDGSGLDRAFNLTKCVLSILGGSATGLVAGGGVGIASGTPAGPIGMAVGGGVGGLIGAFGGAATGAALGCFD